MKRQGYIFEKIIDKNNIKNAIICASNKKRNSPYVKKVLNNIDMYVNKIYNILITESFVPGPYKEAIIDGSSKKQRLISKPKFYPDQIIHWCIMLQIEPLFRKGMYQYNFASVKYRGIHKAKNYIQKVLTTTNVTYCLKLDIKKFYPSINKSILKNKFKSIIKDAKVLTLLNNIVDSYDKGIPIGNYTSQWFGNFYLQDLDHFIKEHLHIKYYARYMDDLVLLADNKEILHKVLVEIQEFLKTEDLCLKQNWQLFKLNSRPLDFVGFKFINGKIYLRKTMYKKIRRKVLKIKRQKYISMKDARTMMSYYGWRKGTNCKSLFTKDINNLFKICRIVISKNKIIKEV